LQGVVNGITPVVFTSALTGHADVDHVLGGVDPGQYPGMLHPALHQKKLWRRFPAVDVKIVAPFVVAADVYLAAPALENAEGIRRGDIPINAQRLVTA